MHKHTRVCVCFYEIVCVCFHVHEWVSGYWCICVYFCIKMPLYCTSFSCLTMISEESGLENNIFDHKLQGARLHFFIYIDIMQIMFKLIYEIVHVISVLVWDF